PTAHSHFRSEEYRAKAYSLQTADHQPLRLPKTTHFTVTAFHHHTMKPAVNTVTLAWRRLNISELGRSILKHHTFFEVLKHFIGHFTAYPYSVLTVHLIRWMHQTVRQLAISGKHQ